MEDLDRKAMKMPGTDAFFTERISKTAEGGKVMLKSAT